VQIRTSATGHKQLWLVFTTENTGRGPLEVQPTKHDCDGNPATTTDRTALQHIYGDTNGDHVYTPGVDTVVRTLKVGCFEYHASHGHWHFADYARYRMETLDTGTKVAAHSKVGFCMLDSLDLDGSLAGHPDSMVYMGCPDLATQGISVGWGDIYDLTVPGQFIPIDDVPDGTYCLVATADPKDRLLESDETDNQVRSQVQLSGDSASLTGDPC
jgi:hypothetical protein